MLALENRLTASSDIKKVVMQGRCVRTKSMNICSSPSSLNHVRFACVAGKKVHASAVVRHGVQRKLRAACREVITTIDGSYDIVVVALTKNIRSMSVRDIAKEITSGLPTI